MATILVVEDNPQNLKLARLVLERERHPVLEAHDGESGLALAREARTLASMTSSRRNAAGAALPGSAAGPVPGSPGAARPARRVAVAHGLACA